MKNLYFFLFFLLFACSYTLEDDTTPVTNKVHGSVSVYLDYEYHPLANVEVIINQGMDDERSSFTDSKGYYQVPINAKQVITTITPVPPLTDGMKQLSASLDGGNNLFIGEDLETQFDIEKDFLYGHTDMLEFYPASDTVRIWIETFGENSYNYGGQFWMNWRDVTPHPYMLYHNDGQDPFTTTNGTGVSIYFVLEESHGSGNQIVVDGEGSHSFRLLAASQYEGMVDQSPENILSEITVDVYVDIDTITYSF